MRRPPSPELIFDLSSGYQRSAVVSTALELDVFTAVGEGVNTVEALEARCNASARGLGALAEYLVALGLLRKGELGYNLTPESAMFLDRHSRAYAGDVVTCFLHPSLRLRYEQLTAAVREGAMPKISGPEADDRRWWRDSARLMGRTMEPVGASIADRLAVDDSRPFRILDLAAGHGMFGIAVAQKNLNATLVALDWEGVVEVAHENAIAAGLSSRVSVIAGDLFSLSFGVDFDLVILGNVLHLFDPLTCELLLRKVREACKPGARIVIVEFIREEDRASSPAVAAFGITILLTTSTGNTYTFRDVTQMLQHSGFSRCESALLPGTPERMITAYAVA